MKKNYTILLALTALSFFSADAQRRYVDPVFTAAEVKMTENVTYATNVEFLTSKFTNPAQFTADLTAIKTALAFGDPIPSQYYDPTNTTTDVKVTDLQFDVYEPDQSVDTETARPVIIYLHTGNFLPPGINGSPNGTRKDSSAIVLCTQWAQRGYVAVAVSYRLGWNPIATTVFERRGTLLNAVYRAIHDVKKSVIYLRDNAAGDNTYKIDGSKVVLYGEGTGAYVANAYTTLDKYGEMELPKFINPATSKSYIDTTSVGRIDGSGGALNLYGTSSTSSDVSMTVAAGGALADTSWLEKGDAAMVSIHCIRDPFAPFDFGTVIVPTTNEDVVDVQGGNIYIQKAMDLGNNDAFKGISGNDPYTKRARSMYGKTYDYILPSPNKVTVSSTPEGLFPILLPLGGDRLKNQASPWQFWDPLSPVAAAKDGNGVSNHQKSLNSNPDMSSAKGRTYIDSIQGYICPRIAVQLGIYTTAQLNVKENINEAFNVYPNPSAGLIYVNGTEIKAERFEMMNTNGQVVAEGTLFNNVIDASSLAPGMYLLNLETENGIAHKKIMIH